MLTRLLYLTLPLSIFLSSCSKDEIPPPPPEAAFAVLKPDQSLDESPVIEYPTWTAIYAVNKSSVGAVYSWDLGDGRVLKNTEPVFHYPKSGEYDVKLTVEKDGLSTVIHKKFRIVDRHIQRITVNSLNWNTSFNTMLNWSANKKAGIFIRIYESENPVFDGPGEKYSGTVAYESPVRENISPQNMPVVFPISNDLILLHPAEPKLYVYCLYAKDDNGREYLLMASRGSGVIDTFYQSLTGRYCYNTFSFIGSEIKIDAVF